MSHATPTESVHENQLVHIGPPELAAAARIEAVVTTVTDDTIEVNTTDFALEEPVEFSREKLDSKTIRPQFAEDGTPIWGY